MDLCACVNEDRRTLFFLCLLEEVKRELKRIHMDGGRYNERLNSKTEGSEHLVHTGLHG